MDPLGHAMRYEYKGGVLVKETNRKGLSFHFEYEWYHPDGYCTRTWGDGGIHERKLTYHKYGFASSVDHGRGGHSTYLGNGAGLVEREVDPIGVEIYYEWDAHCRRTAEIDARKNRKEWEFDDRGNMVVERDALKHETRWNYNDLRLPVEKVDAAGGVWRWVYDHRGCLVKEINPIGEETRFTCDNRGLITLIEGPRDERIVLEYDEQGNNTTGGFVFDELGRLIRTPEERITRDACGRIVRVDRSDGSWIVLKRDPEGNVVERSDDAGRTWRYVYAGMNQLVEQVDPAGNTVKLGYDLEEDLVRVTNERGEVYEYQRDFGGRVTYEIGFDGRKVRFVRDQAGWIIIVINAAGKQIVIERDPLGRMAKMKYPGRIPKGKVIPAIEEVMFSYDELGALAHAKNSDAAVALVHDAIGRVTEERSGDVRIERGYGMAESLKTSLGLEAWFDRGHVSLEGGRWKAERVSEESRLPGGVVDRWERDRFERPSAHWVTTPEISMFRGYRWKTDEELGAFVSAAGTDMMTLGHDLLGHLTWAMGPDGYIEHRGVDPVGNVYGTESCQDRQYGVGSRLERLADGTAFVWDKDGYLIEKVLPDGKRYRYTWDVLGQLIEVTLPSSAKVLFAYDALGRRVSKTAGGKTTR